MKKNLLKLSSLLLATMLISSCSSSDDNNSGPNEQTKDLLNYPYSSLSVSAQKKKLSAEGEAILTQIQDLPNETSIELLNSFNKRNSSLFNLLDENYDQNNLQNTITTLSKYYGEYIWDANNQEWYKSSNVVTDRFIAIFPETRTATANNGKIEIKPISSNVVIENNEIPSNIVADLYAFNTKEGTIEIKSTGINATTYVETANMNADLGAYNLVAKVNKKNNKNESTIDFTKGSASIFNAYADLKAAITASMIQQEDLSSIEDGNFVLTLSDNLAIVGYVDGKSLVPELQNIDKAIDEIYSNWTYSDGKVGEREEAILKYKKQRTTVLNNFTNLALVSTTEKYKIAKITFDLEYEEYEDYAYKYDLDANGYYIPGTEVRYDYTGYYGFNDLYILNFNDSTKVEASVFFGDGFSSVIKMWEDFTLKFN